MEGGRRKNPILGENTRQQIWKGKRTPEELEKNKLKLKARIVAQRDKER